MGNDSEPQAKSPLSDTTVFLMIFCALFADALQALIGWIPVIGNILADFASIFIFLTFLLWFKMNGINMITPKRLRAMAIGGVTEMIPYINILPAWTGVVIYLIGTTKIKEIVEKHPTVAKLAVNTGKGIKKMNKTDRDPHVYGVDE